MAEQWLTEQLHPFYRKSLRVQEMLVDEQTGFSINIYPNWVRYGLDYGQLRDVFGPQGR